MPKTYTKAKGQNDMSVMTAKLPPVLKLINVSLRRYLNILSSLTKIVFDENTKKLLFAASPF
jgi:hypothetical protein